jgi:quercetin dioxygenase-like cupin family protein
MAKRPGSDPQEKIMTPETPDTTPPTIIENLEATLPDIPTDGIVSRVLHSDDRIRVTVFAFDGGQELTEHTSTRPAILQVLRGDARIGLGDDTAAATAGSWIHLPANLRHSVKAETPLILLLTLLER